MRYLPLVVVALGRPVAKEAKRANEGSHLSQTSSSADAEPGELLENENRAEIVDLIAQYPGMNMHQVFRSVDVNVRVVDHHMKRLIEAGVIVRLPSANEREYVHFLPEDEHYWENERTRILFGREPVRMVAMYIAEHPGCTSFDIAEAVDLSPVTVRQHLRTLKDRDLITAGQRGLTVEYHPLLDLREWMEELGDRYPRPWQKGHPPGRT